MDADRTSLALTRIDAALARIEAAARRPVANAAAAADLARLHERHERLRAAVGDSLGQLDTLIDAVRA